MYCLASLLEWQEHNGMHAPDQPGETCTCVSRDPVQHPCAEQHVQQAKSGLLVHAVGQR